MSFDPARFEPQHFLWKFENGVGTITLNRPELAHQSAAFAVEVVGKTVGAIDRAPITKLARQLAVALVEERPGKVSHPGTPACALRRRPRRRA
jgi:hypothetical protein